MISSSIITKYIVIKLSFINPGHDTLDLDLPLIKNGHSHVLTMISCNNHNSMLDYRPVNEGTVNFKNFCVSSETTKLETITKGTIYAEGGKNNSRSAHMEIVAWIEVDPDDWGWVSFSIPWGWRIDSANPFFEIFPPIFH